MIEQAEKHIWSTARVLEQRRFEVLFKGGDPEDHRAGAAAATRRPTAATGTRSSPTGAGRRASRRTSGPRWRRSRTPGAPTRASATTSRPSPRPTAASRSRWRASSRGRTRRGGGSEARARCSPPRFSTPRSRAPASTTRWLQGAEAFCWAAVDAIESTHPYEVEAALTFLDAVPDRERAERAAERLGELVKAQDLVGKQPEGYSEGEIHHPHDFARRPDSLARPWFSDEEIERSLDLLASRQQDDGGWRITWPVWTPAIAIEWSGIVTIAALKTLQAYGRC